MEGEFSELECGMGAENSHVSVLCRAIHFHRNFGTEKGPSVQRGLAGERKNLSTLSSVPPVT